MGSGVVIANIYEKNLDLKKYLGSCCFTITPTFHVTKDKNASTLIHFNYAC